MSMLTSNGLRSTVHLAERLSRTVRRPRDCYAIQWLITRGFTTQTTRRLEIVPLRKHLKDEAKRRRQSKSKDKQQQRDDWELTVGIEVHAQLNTAYKLFSDASTESAAPNGNVTLFDAAMPGAQPSFQVATLLPAIRAALALGCNIQHQSSWDRKHYFHWDQPNGYQLTQYYQPFAKDGVITLTADDGVPESDLNGRHVLSIGIKQIQLEQDTAKTTLHPASTYHIDLNRAGQALVEIITLPHIHSPQTAAATVRKMQAVLKSVNACISGMELGGLRADVNVSVRKRGTTGIQSYSGVEGLGQRTEIKNLSSFKAVEDAIIAERDRQIAVLEAGGVIESETRGWALGSTETTRLRGKEGEVDYRYIPEADLPRLLIGDDLIEHLRSTLPDLPDTTISRIQATYGLTRKDAKTLYTLDEGERLEFMENIVHALAQAVRSQNDRDMHKIGTLVSNWVLHELGGVLTTREVSWQQSNVTVEELVSILQLLMDKQITSRSAKQLLARMVECTTSPRPTVRQLVDGESLLIQSFSDGQYDELAERIMSEHPDTIEAILKRGQRGKIMWLVGQMIRQSDEGTVDPQKARQVLEARLEAR